MAEKITPVDVGETYLVTTSIGKQNLKVLPSCKEKAGRWVCVIHDMNFENNFQKDLHITNKGTHRLAWNCPEHGLEKP
jgi:hypothetical protein